MSESTSSAQHATMVSRNENWRFILIGTVQGVGMRPALAQLASHLGIAGWVRNVDTHVELMVEGEASLVNQFRECISIPGFLPGNAIVAESSQGSFQNLDSFRILPSDREYIATRSDVPLDRVTCPACQVEYLDAKNRRSRYGLISCSSCGPRFSIIKAMPFDRATSAMALFSCCSDCQQEYDGIQDRRYHSQTISCPKCGPQIRGLKQGIEALKRGEVVGLRGLGGYQWIAAAGCESAIQCLRDWKQRPRKPLAVCVSTAYVRKWILDEACRKRLSEDDGSIVIVPSDMLHLDAEQHLAISVRQEVRSLGVMLPTSMLHAELVEEIGPLVVTSANTEGEPMSLAADCRTSTVIDHDRPIFQRIDDSVVMRQCTGFVTVRPARGLTPCSWDLAKAGLKLTNRIGLPDVLALGGEQKVCLAWSDGNRLTLGPYVGNLTSVSMQNAAMEQWRHFRELYRIQPKLVAHDLHPDFFSTQWAMELERVSGVQRREVQHHRAHWLASLLGPGWLDDTVLGFVWDGTGLGEDGSIWGGECLVGNRFAQERIASLLPFALPGGEAAIREPWRVGVALLSQLNTDLPFRHFKGVPVRTIQAMISHGLRIVSSTSLGRLFDAVAAIVLGQEIGCRKVSFEGELAQLLEEHCDMNEVSGYDLPLCTMANTDGKVKRYWDWRPMLSQVAKEKLEGVSIGKMAMRFHRGLVQAVLDVAKIYPQLPMTLSGGCFQNRVLIQLLQESDIELERKVAWPGLIPVNDSGLAIGQVIEALSWWEKSLQNG